MSRAREGDERGRGASLTDEAQRYRHFEQTGEWPIVLPERGSGLSRLRNLTGSGFFRLNNEWLWLGAGAIGVLIFFLLRKKKIQGK